MLLLSDNDVRNLIGAKECVAWLEEAYRELADDRTGSIPRGDSMVGREGAGCAPHRAPETMVGTSPRHGVTALRLDSGILSLTIDNNRVRRVNIAAANHHYAGLVMLFSNATAEPLVAFPDGMIQRLRVGATNALAAQYLARPSACTLGLLGAGWQAGGNLLALCSTFPINCVKIYSPNEERRRRFAAEMTLKLDCEIVCTESARQAVEHVDMIVCATNALSPVMQREWLKPGVHLTCGMRSEVEPEAYLRCDVLIQHSAGAVDRDSVGEKGGDRPETAAGKEDQYKARINWSVVPELRDLVVGKTSRRTNDREITCFCNNVGMGFQFAALGAHVYERARERGLGTEIPTEWFTQDVHP